MAKQYTCPLAVENGIPHEGHNILGDQHCSARGTRLCTPTHDIRTNHCMNDYSSCQVFISYKKKREGVS